MVVQKKQKEAKKMDDFAIVIINGIEYYVPTNLVEYISNEGVSTYSSNFYGYPSLDSNYTGSYYPRIQFRSLAYPVLYSSSNNYTVLTGATVEFSPHAQFIRFSNNASVYSAFLLIVIAFFVMFRRFK